MKTGKLAELLQAEVFTGNSGLGNEINNVYVGDLLSRVISTAPQNCVWITVHSHVNIAAAAVIAGISCIIMPEGIKPQEDTVIRASENDICIMSSKLDAYRICAAISEFFNNISEGER